MVETIKRYEVHGPGDTHADPEAWRASGREGDRNEDQDKLEPSLSLIASILMMQVTC